MEKLSEDTQAWLPWMIQAEYKHTIKNSDHLPEEERPYQEIQLIHRLNEICFFHLNVSLDIIIRRNIFFKMAAKDLPIPSERYHFYAFEIIDFTEHRLAIIRQW